jgi:GTP-binding protein HflX
MAAFKATLEELEDADLLLHIVDVSNPLFEQHIESVEKIIEELRLSNKPRLLILNKTDKLEKGEAEKLARRYNAVAISALDSSTFQSLLNAIEERVFLPWHTPEKENFAEVIK